MTKEKFREYITALMDSVTSLPDDIWMDTFPTISIRLGNEEAYIGVRETYQPLDTQEEDDDL